MNLQARRDPYKLVGTTLDRYQIQELVGIGGMGAVYRARHEITKAVVAIKILRPDLAFKDQEGMSLFFEEATKTVGLNHPSIIRVTTADYTSDGWAYMVMEWLDGRTLDAEMTDEGVLSLQRTASILEQLTEAIAYAHSKGIIHRDLKPSNIMLVDDENGEETVRVLDFGIAKVLSTTLSSNPRVSGTSHYIAPEQSVAHSRIDQSADIYSLGVILYQMLTGQLPFEADTEGQVMDMHRSIAPRPLREIRPSIPQAVEEVVLRAIAKRPVDRFHTATELARAFREAANLASSELALQCIDAETEMDISSADVYLNGKRSGQSDDDGWWRGTNMMPRQYLIEVEAPRYVRWHKSVELGAREGLTLIAKLERQQVGEMVVTCNVGNVEVAVDNEIAGRTDQRGRLYLQSVSAGTHTLKLTHPQYLQAESSVEVQVWQQAYAPVQLIARPRRDLFKLMRQKFEALSATRSVKQIEDLVGRVLIRRSNASVPAKQIRPADENPAPEPERSSLTRTCHQCQEQIPIAYNFCTECGSFLGSAKEAEVTGKDRPADRWAAAEPKPVSTDSVKVDDPEVARNITAVALRHSTAMAVREPDRYWRFAKKALWPALGAVAMSLIVTVTWLFFFYVPKQVLTVVVSPSGSRVVVDDRIERTADGEGKVSIGELEGGLHTIKVSKPGYEELTQSVTLPISQPLQLVLEKVAVETPEGMILIPGGAFIMGYRTAARTDPSGPEHEVTVKSFFIDRYEITRGAYLKDGRLSDETRDLPITGVTWKEADAFCKSIGKRLPTEEEWEFAARGADRRLYPWGNKFEPKRANIGTSKLFPVGSYPAGNSPFGVSDMSGNALEWTDSNFVNYVGSLYQPRRCKEPCKVIRGGAYFDAPQNATAVFRREYEPTALKNVRNAYMVLGFRCAKTPTPK